MTKKVLGTNCKITKLPSGWKATTDGKGTCHMDVPDASAGMFGGVFSAKAININGFSAVAFDGSSKVVLTGVSDSFDETGFHDVA